MSILRPEQQKERVYGLDSTSLGLIIARGLQLSREEYIELQRWRESQVVDLAGCVLRVMQKRKRNATPAQSSKVMVEEIDQALLQAAAFNPNSSAEVQDLQKTWKFRDEEGAIGNLYQRLQAKEAKWLTRLILKSYAPVVFPDTLQMASGQSFLPRCISISLQIPTSTPAAIRQIGTGLVRGMAPKNPNPLPTPPTSSAMYPPTSAPKPATVTSPSSSVSTTYTPATRRASIQKSPRRSEPRCSQGPSTIPSSAVELSARTVLGVLSANVARGSQNNSQPKTHQIEAATPLRISGHGICHLTDTCKFTGYLFLLSPCISGVPWVVDDLLPRHGGSVITSLASLSHPSLPRHCPHTGRRYRKIALVEPNRVEQTATFMKMISRLNLKRKGKKEWVEIYDWRVLECVTKLEQGKSTSYDPWKRCWIGAV